MAQFRKKPVVIEAVQFRSDLTPEVMRVTTNSGMTFEQYPVYIDERGPFVAITTLEGTMRLDNGDWLITGVKGERYPCKLDIFDATYEPA